MAIKRANSNPIVYLDVAIASVEADHRVIYVDGPDGKRIPKVENGEQVREYVGRRLLVQTGMPNSDLLEVRVSSDFDGIQFGAGEQRLIVAEYSEYDFNGRTGSILRWLADVSAAQVEQWRTFVKATQTA